MPPALLGMRGAFPGNVCSTTDYTDVVAKALGMTAPELRLALTSGKTVQDLVTSKNVNVQTVRDALTAARKADLDQAVKDGLLTQQQADALSNIMTNGPRGGRPGGNNNNQPGNGDQNQPGQPGATTQRVPLFGVSARNVVHELPVAAKAIGISCADLVKAMQGGKSIVQVAADKNVQVQTVVDALVNARKDALAQDVKEGLITQAQSDAQSSRLVEQVTAMISRSGGRGQRGGLFGLFGNLFGGRGPFGGRGNQGGPNNQGGRGGQNGNPQPTPQATQAVQ